MQLFSDDVGTPIIKTIEGAEQGSRLLFYGSIIFGLLMIGLTLTMLLLRKKFVKVKNKDYIDLP